MSAIGDIGIGLKGAVVEKAVGDVIEAHPILSIGSCVILGYWLASRPHPLLRPLLAVPTRLFSSTIAPPEGNLLLPLAVGWLAETVTKQVGHRRKLRQEKSLLSALLFL